MPNIIQSSQIISSQIVVSQAHPTQIGPENQEYWRKIMALLGSSVVAYWPLWEQSGTVSRDIINGLNGTYRANATIGNPGIGDKHTSMYNDGVQGSVEINTALGLSNVFNGAEGSFLCWIKTNTIAEWTDGANRFPFQFATAAYGVPFYISKQSANNHILFNALGKYVSIASYASTNWMHVVLSWSNANDKLTGWLNGLTCGDASGLTAWGANALGKAFIGGQNTTVGSWKGNIAHVLLLNRYISDAEVKQTYYFLTPPSSRISIIGDSIVPRFMWFLEDQYKSGSNYIANHAAVSNSISSNIATQAAATAGDNANIVIMQLGTNDDNAAVMSVLQTKVETAIDTVRANNPNATVYYMNVLPRWTDVSGTTPVDKSNIRTMIATACTNKGVTCWDTFSVPWITASDTDDGLHPNGSGAQKIVTNILALLP